MKNILLEQVTIPPTPPSGGSDNPDAPVGTSGGSGTSGTSGESGTSGTSGGSNTSGTSGGSSTSGTSGASPNFGDDTLLSQLNPQFQLKLDTYLGIKPSSYTDTVDGIRFYKSSRDSKVYLRTHDNLIVLIKDVPGNVEKAKSSEYTLDQFKQLTDQELESLFDRVKNIQENKSNMKKILKEEYHKRQSDKEIISKRFNILSESRSAESIILEIDYLQKQKFSRVLIKEALFDLINLLYKDDPNTIPKLKDSYKNWLTKKLPNEGDLFTRNLEKSIDNIKNEEVPLLFSDCNKIVDLIYSSMIENMVDDNFDVVGVPNDIESIIKKEIIDNLKRDELKMKIKDQLTNKICPQYGELMRNTEKTFEDLKGKLLS